jgi:ribosome maturation factor RimP
MTAMLERLRELVVPACDANSVDLYDLEFAGGILRVLVSRQGGADLDAIASVTREISRTLDATDPIHGHYTLEVSSPGLERPLRTPAHFAAAVGSDAYIKIRPDIDGDRRVEGVIVRADADGVTIRFPGADAVASEQTVLYADIDKARTVFIWGPSPKPGSVKTPKQPKSQKHQPRRSDDSDTDVEHATTNKAVMP